MSRNAALNGKFLDSIVGVTVHRAAAGDDNQRTLEILVRPFARVIWSQGSYCGVAFDEAIVADAKLPELFESQKSKGYRAIRLPVDSNAILATHQGQHATFLVNIYRTTELS